MPTSKFNVDALIKALRGEPAVHVPEWNGEIEGYTVNFVQQNYWRVKRTMPRDDVMQECVCIFLRCKRKYLVREAKHFMALYKVSITNSFADWSSRDTQYRQIVTDVIEREGGVPSVTFELPGEMDNDGYLATLIRQAPEEVLMVLNLVLRAPQELLEDIFRGWNGTDARSKANGSKRINELLGLPLDQDTLGSVRRYFS